MVDLVPLRCSIESLCAPKTVVTTNTQQTTKSIAFIKASVALPFVYGKEYRPTNDPFKESLAVLVVQGRCISSFWRNLGWGRQSKQPAPCLELESSLPIQSRCERK